MTAPLDLFADESGKIDPGEALTELLRSYRDQARFLVRADNYYRAEPSSVNIGSRIPPALALFRTPWPAVRAAVNAYTDRVSIEDIKLSDDDQTAEEIRDPIQPALTMAILEAVAIGNGYLRTVVKSDGSLLFTAVRGRDGAFLEDRDTGETLATMRVHRPRRWIGPVSAPRRVTVYTPGRATTFAIQGTSTVNNAGWGILEDITFPKAPDAMLMRPILNRQRAGEEYGRSEARDLYPLQDQGSRALTNIAIISDSLAVPQRVLIASQPDSFKDLSMIQTYLDSILTLSGTDVHVDQWQAAQLSPLLEQMLMLGRQASAISGIPIIYWGIAGDRTQAADAIRENDARLVIRATQLSKQWTPAVKGCIEDASRLLGRNPGQVELVWSDPATPTPAAAVDAAVKLASIPPVAGEPVIDREYLWDVIRMPPESRERIRELGDSVTLAQLLTPPEAGANEPGSVPPGPPTNPGGPPNVPPKVRPAPAG